MIRYYITDSRALGGTQELLARLPQLLAAGVDIVQVREKHLPAADLLRLTRQVVAIARERQVKVVVNSRLDVALAAEADGVHLPANSPSPRVWKAFVPAGFLWGVSCHSREECQTAEADGADWAVFSPVFASPGKGAPQGLAALAAAARAVQIPVLALGGVHAGNAASCLEAGAAGIAGIRLFQDPELTPISSEQSHEA